MKLGKLCILFTDGDWIESKDQSDSGIRLIQTGNIGNGEFLYKNDKAKYISVDTFKRLNCKEVFPNDILVSRLPEPVGRGCIIPDIGEKMITAVDCTICRINENLVDRKYFCYFLESNAYKTQLEQHVTGTTRKRISRKNLSSIEIDIPEQAKQKEVVYKLDRLKKIIQNYNRELDLLDELIKARFVEMFGDPRINDKKWKAGKIVDYFEVKGGKRIPKGMGYAERKTNHPYLRASDMKNATILDDDIHYIDEEVYKRIKRYTVNAHDIYLTNVGVNLGMAGVIPKKYDGANLTENAVKLVPKDKILLNGMFLSYYINSPGIQHYINERKMSVGVPKLAIFRIESMPLLLPPLELQNQFASFVQEIDKSRSRIQKSLEASQELFDSLMQEYFG